MIHLLDTELITNQFVRSLILRLIHPSERTTTIAHGLQTSDGEVYIGVAGWSDVFFDSVSGHGVPAMPEEESVMKNHIIRSLWRRWPALNTTVPTYLLMASAIGLAEESLIDLLWLIIEEVHTQRQIRWGPSQSALVLVTDRAKPVQLSAEWAM